MNTNQIVLLLSEFSAQFAADPITPGVQSIAIGVLTTAEHAALEQRMLHGGELHDNYRCLLNFDSTEEHALELTLWTERHLDGSLSWFLEGVVTAHGAERHERLEQGGMFELDDCNFVYHAARAKFSHVV